MKLVKWIYQSYCQCYFLILLLFQPNLHFRFELERIIDDWILLGFLVGNDFVPHLPHMHIIQDALPYLYRIYKEFMPTTDGNCFSSLIHKS